MRRPHTTEHPPNDRLAIYQEPSEPNVWNLSLPLGVTCPHAKACKTFVPPTVPVPIRGRDNQFLCAFAQRELNVKTSRVVWNNLRLLLEALDMRALLRKSISDIPDSSVIRLHQWGDFYSPAYLGAWFDLIRATPSKSFEVSTKSLPWLWDELGKGVPDNARIIVSSGGTHDSLIPDLQKLGCSARHVAYSMEHLNNTDLQYLTDIDTRSPLKEATFVAQGLQYENTTSGDFVNEIGSGETMPVLVP